MKRKVIPLCVVLACIFTWGGVFAKHSVTAVASEKWVDLLDKDLTHWDVWTAVPHASIKTLPDGYIKGSAIGLSDPYGVYSTERDTDGNLIMRVSGEVYGGLTSKTVYENYHLSLEFKWGEKKWAPRLDKKRDSGILYHATGEHGEMWKVWKKSVELQIMEGDMGDLFLLGGPSAQVHVNDDLVWTPAAEAQLRKGHVARAVRSTDMESTDGEWTRIDLYVLGNTAVHVVNGTVVMVLFDIQLEGKPLIAGELQLQSEGAECYYRNIRIRSIEALPDAVKLQAQVR